MAKKPKPEGKKYNYMDTYGDLVTLLLCFFVLLFAMSTVEETKYNAFVNAMTQQFGPRPANLSTVTRPNVTGDDFGDEAPTAGETADPVMDMPADMRELYEDISQYIEDQALEGKVEIEVGTSGAIFIRLTDNLIFSGDSAALSDETMDFLDFMGGGFVAVQDSLLQVDIIGHTASIEGSGTDDWVLSNERAARVASYLERSVGLSPYKMHTAAYGRHYPIADNGTEAFAKNRRVDIIVVGNDADNLLLALAEAQRVYFPGDDTQFFEGGESEMPAYSLDNAIAAQREMDLSNLSDAQLRELYDMVNKL